MLDEPLDLSFQPTVNPAPKRMTPDQIAHFNRNGYVQPFNVFDTAEIADVRAYVDSLMADMGEAGGYGINCYQARLSGLWDIANDPRILDLVEDLIGADVICWATAILSKMPNDPKRVPWHQDASFWSLSPARTVTASCGSV